MFDYHIHSEFSDDSTEKMSNIVEEAIKKGGKKLCFTEHMEFNYPHEELKFELDYDAYKKEFERIKSIYGGKIDLYMGVEMGIQGSKREIEETINYAKNHEFDFIIASAHCLEGEDLYSMDPETQDIDEFFTRYFHEMLNVFKHYSDYDVVGHIDLIRRYFLKAHDHKLGKSQEVLRELLSHIINSGKGIEINTGGLFYKSANTNPTIDILKLYREMGGEIITIGSDAHIAERVMSNYSKAIEALDTAGFKYVTTYSKREKEFHKIR
ncbi:histidinol-phosphatase HisJ family protein [uncultured Ilyobacter sp.]|uniref:histidinol-phosphatase HisJ family protein n=1 Tax=uncultured Ilyobacter sp. TaxID=544433 RepID=UPI0029C0ABFC|nr:histidinol-phosphatase HisJ family protein [uncultured Ilyobacter sp.]